jgi:large subunit ribosomal protein L2
MKAEVLSIEYDPNRTAFIALVKYEDGEKRYILAPKGLKEGDVIEVVKKVEVKLGSRMQLKNIPEGTEIYNMN